MAVDLQPVSLPRGGVSWFLRPASPRLVSLTGLSLYLPVHGDYIGKTALYGLWTPST